MKNRSHKMLMFLLTILLASTSSYGAEVKHSKPTLDQVYDLIKTYHIGGQTPREKSRTSMKDMLKELDDPYAAYYSKQQVTDLLTSVQGPQAEERHSQNIRQSDNRPFCSS